MKERKIKALENLVTEQVEEINILRDNNLSMVNELKEKLRDNSENKNDEEKYLNLEMDFEHLKIENVKKRN